eukprot:GSChrysophyteH1.ASY1.ANO1.2962.1 assembled CDS
MSLGPHYRTIASFFLKIALIWGSLKMKRTISERSTGRVLRSRGVELGSMNDIQLNDKTLRERRNAAKTTKIPKFRRNEDELQEGSRMGSPRGSKECPVNLISELGPPLHIIEDIDDYSSQQDNISGLKSCLLGREHVEDQAADAGSPKGLMRPIILRRAVSIRELDDDSWLSSSLIDLVISKFAKTYKDVHFMSIDFVILSLSGATADKQEMMKATDITGRGIDYENDTKPIVFVCNSNNIHWNLIRVIRHPKPQLQLFEPMGKPLSRHKGLGYRDVPRCIIKWLDLCAPLDDPTESWIHTGISAIENQQQFTPFDCGVACLLYAEKCGLGQDIADINANTSQADITQYRTVLQEFMRRLNALD